MRDAVDAGLAGRRRAPPGLRVAAVRGDHSDACEQGAPLPIGQRDHRARCAPRVRTCRTGLVRAHAETSLSSSGSETIIADWNPPNPLAVESAVRTVLRRASCGV